MRTSVDRHYLEPGVLFVKKPHVFICLKELNRIGRVHRTDVTEWQTGSGIIAFLRFVAVPLRLSPLGVRKRAGALLLAVTSDIRHIGPLPDSVEIGLTPGSLRSWTFRRLISALALA